MALHIKKSLDELMVTGISRLENVTLSDGKHLSAKPGGVARLLLTIINASLEEFYTRLEEVHLQSFLSTASGEGLDLVASLINCTRKAGEEDEVYRARISQQVRILEKANELAVRMAILSVDGVQDVNLVPYTHGSGSFTGFIITETAMPSESIIYECRAALADVVAYGIKYNIEGPDLIPVEMGIKLIMLNNTEAPNDLIEKVRDRVRTFINSRKIGEELIFNEIVETVMATSEDIYDMEVFNYKVNELRVLNTNQSCRGNERFIESTKPGAITVL